MDCLHSTQKPSQSQEEIRYTQLNQTKNLCIENRGGKQQKNVQTLRTEQNDGSISTEICLYVNKKGSVQAS